MCGIYGSTFPYSEHEVKKKLERTKFRGPDEMGWRFFQRKGEKLVLGHNRLSIIDLDPRSNQPFTYQEHIHIVFNGEIYNFKSIRSDLREKGFEFHTTSDTEVVCAAYLEFGESCVNQFIGMFAFVIYDEKKQILFGAKDRVGQKPFYYSLRDGHFEFASQISSLQLYNDNLTISQDAINDYLIWGSIPYPKSIFNEIHQLRDGHIFTYQLENGEFNTRPYWDINYKSTEKSDIDYNQAVEELEELLTDSVKIRLFADVPVGIFLSGGVDSSLIAALATKTTDKKVKTFSVKFGQTEFDESRYAEQVATHLGTDHHTISCNYAEGIDLIESFSYYFDEPFCDSSAIPMMLLAKYTKEHVTVALSGDGGDENFLGYHRYNWLRYIKKIMAFPKPLRLLAASTLKVLPYYKLKVIAGVIDANNIEEAYLKSKFNLNPRWLTTKDGNPKLDEFKYLFHNSKNIFEKASDFDIKTYLNWDINKKVDMATMAYSLEARSPFLDHRVVEFSRSLPTSFKFNGTNQKRILKDILYKHVPESIFDRPKSGFTMPFKEWFRTELKSYVIEELSETNLSLIPNLKVDKVMEMVRQHMDGSWNHYPFIWKILVLLQWLKKNGRDYSIK